MTQTLRLFGVLAALTLVACSDDDNTPAPERTPSSVQLVRLSSIATGPFNEDGGGAEVPAYDPASRRAFVVNAVDATVDVVNLATPATPVKLASIDTSAFGSANSVAVSNGVLAVAIQSDDKTDPGVVAFYRSSDSTLIGTATVGSMPDMVAFTPDGRYALTANEGEPSEDYSVDPEGSISIVEVATRTVRTAGFATFNAQAAALRTQGVRLFGPGASVAQDLEPEYIAVSADSKTAYATLQENNAIAVVDIDTATVTAIRPLGFKDHSLANNGFGSSNALDASDRDDAVNIANWPVFGVYMPDTMSSYTVGAETLLVMANEGDARVYPTSDDAVPGLEEGDVFNEESRIKDLTLDAAAFPNAAALQADEQIGRLNVTTTLGDTDNDGEYEQLYAFGGRSFSIRRTDGTLVWDSGDALERKIAEVNPAGFNSTHSENESADSRSDNKGPEPEALTLATIGTKTFAFVGMERDSGLFVYDITTPTAPLFLQYLNERDFDVEDATEAGDLGPEGLVYVKAADSPTGNPLLIVANEISGTLTVYTIQQTF